jgi:hypothetical protein
MSAFERQKSNTMRAPTLYLHQGGNPALHVFVQLFLHHVSLSGSRSRLPKPNGRFGSAGSDLCATLPSAYVVKPENFRLQLQLASCEMITASCQPSTLGWFMATTWVLSRLRNNVYLRTLFLDMGGPRNQHCSETTETIHY